MKRILATLILLSLTTFGITVQESIIENTLKFEGTKPLGQSVRGIELSTLTRYNKLKGTKWKLSTLTHNQAVTILKEFYWWNE
jgi:lysozyme family protein